MPKFIRKQPLSERISAYLNPYDILLWLSEELESNGWDQVEKEWAIPIGIVLNVLCLIARANTQIKSRSYDDVFGEVQSAGWIAWLATFMVHFLTLVSVVNAAYTFWRKKHYRLFENDIDTVPSTPSAHRVRVDSSPVSSSPLRFLSNMLGTQTAQSRAHPDAARDVWEVAVWDPLPISLRLFCYFSPGHVLIYWMFLPTLPADPRPSVRVATAVGLALLFSLQLSVLHIYFSQQSKDSSYISKEVLHEYDTKYVRPRTQPLYREVGTQFTEQAAYTPARDKKYNSVDTYTPMVMINRGFKTNPNPNYSQHVDPESSNKDALRFRTPASSSATSNYAGSSSARPLTAIRQPNFRAVQTGEGGSLGAYTHAASPLRKSASTNFAPRNQYVDDVNRARSSLSPEKRPVSPNKRQSVPTGGVDTMVAAQRWGHLKPARSRRESGRI